MPPVFVNKLLIGKEDNIDSHALERERAVGIKAALFHRIMNKMSVAFNVKRLCLFATRKEEIAITVLFSCESMRFAIIPDEAVVFEGAKPRASKSTRCSQQY